MKKAKILDGIICVLLIVVLAKLGIHFVEILITEAGGPVHDDYPLYTIVGRGILNGLTPYVDLYESKPPGMYLLSALSLLLTNGERLATIINVLLMIIIPLLLAGYCLMKSKDLSILRRSWIVMLGLLLSIILMLYTEARAGALQTEAFGAFFGCLYVMTIVGIDRKKIKMRTILCSLFLLLSIGMKEPFVLIGLAAAMLLSRDLKEFIEVFVIPILIASVVGLILLAVLGYLGPYFKVYLPAMTLDRIQDETAEPLLLRGFALKQLRNDLTFFSPSFFLGHLVALLWILIPVFKNLTRSIKHTISSTVAIAVSLPLFHLIYSFVVLWLLMKAGDVEFGGVSYIWRPLVSVIIAFSIVVLALIHSYRNSKKLFFSILLSILSIYIISFTVGLGGGYSNYHYAFAVPIYLAFAALCMRYLSSTQSRIIAVPILLLVIVVGLTYQNDSRIDDLNDLQKWNAASNSERNEKIDQLLTSCEIDRYILAGPYHRFAFLKHSPIGPIMVDAHPYLDHSHPLHVQTRDNMARDGKMIIAEEGSSYEGIPSWLLVEFAETNPPCAHEYLPIEGVTVMFRRT